MTRLALITDTAKAQYGAASRARFFMASYSLNAKMDSGWSCINSFY